MMIKLIAKILLVSDFHGMVVPPGQQKGQVIKGIARIVEWRINIWKRWNNPNIEKALKKIARLGHFDRIISGGDTAECVYNEQGILTIKDATEIKKLKEKLEAIAPTEFVSGDHELGYILPLSVDPEGGMSEDSIKNYLETVSPSLWKSFKVSKFHFLLISSSLITQDYSSRPLKEKEYLDDIVSEQYVFMRYMLSEVGENEQVFLFVHDPDCLEKINQMFPKLENKVARVFCGHMHAEESLKAYERLGKIANSRLAKIISLHSKGKKIMLWAKGNLERLKIFKKYKLQIIPATGGMMGKGRGFLVLRLFDDGSYKIEKHKV